MKGSSHVVDPASIATSRRRRRAKTDGIDGEALVRALLATSGRTRVCAMVKAPTPEEEDRRRPAASEGLIERVHVNRVRGCCSQGAAATGGSWIVQTGDGRRAGSLSQVAVNIGWNCCSSSWRGRADVLLATLQRRRRVARHQDRGRPPPWSNDIRQSTQVVYAGCADTASGSIDRDV